MRSCFRPSAINLDNYGEGWLFEMEGSADDLLSPSDYLTHFAAVWVTLRRRFVDDSTSKSPVGWDSMSRPGV